jgi:hypothetical protein
MGCGETKKAEASTGEASAVTASGAGDHETAGGDADGDGVAGEEACVDEPDAAEADLGDLPWEMRLIYGRVVSRTDSDMLCGRFA